MLQMMVLAYPIITGMREELATKKSIGMGQQGH
jgi:hypothetical protein